MVLPKSTANMYNLRSIWFFITLHLAIYFKGVNSLSIDYSVAPHPIDYCMGTPLNAQCQSNEVIVMVTADYGRMELNNPCISRDMGYLGCSTNVLKITDSYCSGKQMCEMMVPNDALDKTQKQLRNNDDNNCYNTEFRLYLRASYICVRVIKPSENTCHTPMTIPVSSTGGIISSKSTVTPSSNKQILGCGPNTNYPWTLEAQPGQTLNISLTDFGWQSHYRKIGYCSDEFSYGHIVDPEKDNYKILICGGRERNRHIYTSVGTSVKVVIFDEAKARNAGFLIHYEAIGCPDLIPPKHAWMSRDGNKAVIGCHDNLARQTWHLTCKGHRWIGVIGNCTQHVEAAKQAALLASKANSKLPHELAICIIIGLALFISLLIIIIGFVILKRYKKYSSPHISRIYHPDHQIYEEPKYKTRTPVYDLTPTNPTNITGNKQDAIAPGNIMGKRNEYTHIWEYPLPEPCSQHGTPTHTSNSQDSSTTTREQQQINNNNSQPPYLQPQQEQYGGSIDSKTNSDVLSRYYALDQTPQDFNVFHTSSMT